MKFKVVLLGDVAEVKSGKRLPKGRELQSNKNSHPYVRIRDMYKNKYINIDREIMYLPDDIYPSISKYTVNTDDVILANVGNTIGLVSKIGQTLNNANLTENCVKFVNLNGIISDYLYYYLTSKIGQQEIKKGIVGSSQPKLPLYNIKKFKISLPSIECQKKIGNILSNIDKKIDLNNEINNNLYEISKQLLLKYLDDNIKSEEINISELLNVFTGKKNANETSLNGKYKFFSCAPDSLLSDTYLYDGAAIIVAGNGAYTGRTRFYDGKFELYQRTYGLTLKDGLSKNNIYGLYVFMKTVFEPDKMGGTHGSAIPYIVLSDLTNYKLKYNKNGFDRFSDLVSNNIKMIQENEKSNEKLSQLRDTLLPKLMNGEIDLDNIEI